MSATEKKSVEKNERTTVPDKPGDDLAPTAVRTRHYNFDRWFIAVSEGPILPDSELGTLEEKLKLKSMPDMIFDDNMFSISFGAADCSIKNANPKAHLTKPPLFSFAFETQPALAGIEPENYEHIRVATATDWQRTRDIENAPMKDKGNWTFSTGYRGSLKTANDSINFKPTTRQIDYDRLRDRTKPICKSEDIILFEDELDDNGQAQLRLRFRLMQDCFFILFRYYLRLDNVLIRLIETRYYTRCGENSIVRESCYREMPWEACARHPKAQSFASSPTNPLYNPDILTHFLLEDKNFAAGLTRDDKVVEELTW